MKNILVSMTAMLALAAANGWAKAPPDATGECKDGTYTTAAKKEGACSSHGGVKKWLAKEDKGAKQDKAKPETAAKPDKAEKASKPEKAAKPDKAEKASKPDDKGSKAAEKSAAAKPADATGECKDGTYTTSATKAGACAGHKGVKSWYGGAKEAEPKASAKSAAPSSSAASSSMAPPAAAAPSPAPAGAKAAASAPPAERKAAAGGGAGKVWVNTDSKVYHCDKDALYGKTRQGEYMTEAQAKASGARAARGKECS